MVYQTHNKSIGSRKALRKALHQIKMFNNIFRQMNMIIICAYFQKYI